MWDSMTHVANDKKELDIAINLSAKKGFSFEPRVLFYAEYLIAWCFSGTALMHGHFYIHPYQRLCRDTMMMATSW
jgi:hypothetical protein